MQVNLITPEASLFSGEGQLVYIPGTLGDFEVLPGHEPFISTIRPGVITVEAEGTKLRVAVMSGIAEITPEHCNVLIDHAIDVSAYTTADAQAKLAEAKAAADDADTDAERKLAAQKLAMAEGIVYTLTAA